MLTQLRRFITSISFNWYPLFIICCFFFNPFKISIMQGILLTYHYLIKKLCHVYSTHHGALQRHWFLPVCAWVAEKKMARPCLNGITTLRAKTSVLTQLAQMPISAKPWQICQFESHSMVIRIWSSLYPLLFYCYIAHRKKLVSLISSFWNSKEVWYNLECTKWKT